MEERLPRGERQLLCNVKWAVSHQILAMRDKWKCWEKISWINAIFYLVIAVPIMLAAFHVSMTAGLLALAISVVAVIPYDQFCIIPFVEHRRQEALVAQLEGQALAHRVDNQAHALFEKQENEIRNRDALAVAHFWADGIGYLCT